VHDVVDTEQQDAFQEDYWPDRFKDVLRGPFAEAVRENLAAAGSFTRIYEESYRRNYSTCERFIQRIAEAAVIGAENGADDTFVVIDGFIDTEGDLPSPRLRPYALVQAAGARYEREVTRAIVAEYGGERFYQHEHGHCLDRIPDYNIFMERLAARVAQGAMNGADEMMARVYRSLFWRLPLPVARRRPKRLRRW
jgi:hypothetical protein